MIGIPAACLSPMANERDPGRVERLDNPE